MAEAEAEGPPAGDWLGTPFLRFERHGPLAHLLVDRPYGSYDRMTMDASLAGPEPVEGWTAFRERRSPDWVHPDLRTPGRI